MAVSHCKVNFMCKKVNTDHNNDGHAGQAQSGVGYGIMGFVGYASVDDYDGRLF